MEKGGEGRFKMRIRKDALKQESDVDYGVYASGQYTERLSRRGPMD